jgi:hypothetical protein
VITRVNITEKYKIEPPTFDAVEPMLLAKKKPEHGRVFYNINERDDFVLRCARNHIASFGGKGRDNAHILPFHRFLCLKFLTTPQDEAVSEIYQRNLATDHFGLGYYKKLEARFVARIPKELRRVVKKREAPSEKQLNAYEMMLNVIGVITSYNHPLWMDNFFSFLSSVKTKNIVETVLTSRGSRREHQLALEELSGQQWKNVALDLYNSVFYDVGALSDEDWKYYLSIILPTERRAKSQAKHMSTNDLRVKEGDNPHFQETLRMVAVGLEKKIRATMAMKGEGFKQIHQLINMYAKIGMATGGVERPGAGGTFFQNISVKPSNASFKTINAEITGQVADGRA